jgi:phosphocarrier protein
MVTKELTVINDSGIHARPAALIVETATRFRSNVFFYKDGVRANAKSIMNIMLLAAEPGAVIRVETEGPDEGDALAAIESLFVSRFKYE